MNKEFSVSFALDIPSGWDGEDYSLLKAKIESEAEVIKESSDGEYQLYTIAVADVSNQVEPLTISLIGEGGVMMELPTTIDPVSGWHYTCVQDTHFPLMFSFLIGEVYDSRAGGEIKSKRLLKRQQAIGQLSADNQFRVGFSLGMAHSCMDLYYGKSGTIPKAIYYDPKAGGMKMSMSLNQGSTGGVRMDILFPISIEDVTFDNISAFGICELMLYCMKLYLSGDQRKDEFVIALLTGDWGGLGLTGYEFNDCRDHLGHYGAEILESLCENFLEESVLDQGLYLGQGVSEILRIIRGGCRAAGVNNYYSKAQFLNDLG